MGKNLDDPDFVPWLTPDFTTTSDMDRVAATVLFMGAMRQCFEYTCASLWCGIPSVTLLDDREDWARVQSKIEKMPNLGSESAEFARRLRIIAKYIVASSTILPMNR